MGAIAAGVETPLLSDDAEIARERLRLEESSQIEDHPGSTVRRCWHLCGRSPSDETKCAVASFSSDTVIDTEVAVECDAPLQLADNDPAVGVAVSSAATSGAVRVVPQRMDWSSH